MPLWRSSLPSAWFPISASQLKQSRVRPNRGAPSSFAINISGTGYDYFSASPQTGSVPSGSSTSINVSVVKSCTVSIVTTATLEVTGGNSTLDIPMQLTCLGANWQTNLSPNDINFSSLPGGVSPSPQSFSLANYGATSTFNITVIQDINGGTVSPWIFPNPTSGTLNTNSSRMIDVYANACPSNYTSGMSLHGELKISGGGDTIIVYVNNACR